ncbi:amidase [Paraburkholderia tropica]|uniref:Asp-tRNA(Asn)/Glu-tRNA(Gln) amidotransferase A subunit family amidase n=1 Tax=Paraburkholderia tropica TaxID=92647 RepID=A0ABX5MQV7_9BURK|nr:amidase family protein [Paraburkholderia tropica]MDE1144427.1 amidase family protein [Paraburkholderia tropica]PXX17317.1 Asp-tRNA(Asn)/Glu-tRNA(Gln) amidotransferase A subunit family amidase [Paraburkholderia tropica]PZW84498.1 Asp-tRNA(Asn)/Glu-tRNA(Gln) amidotransferase A subunit family amidase [Paraburkholderia tropica]
MSVSLADLSAVDARRLIGNGELSPVELLDACLARIESIEPPVNALAATAFERARDEARRAEQAVVRGEALGVLHGLPIGVKDLEETGGLLTTYGSPLYRDHVPVSDNAFVARLRAAGAIVAAKTNVPEMGAGANTRNAVWGATGNPFDTRLNAGGSSGGSAVALATGMLPLATGSDLGGSLRIPAALCGVVGYRASPGLVPSERRVLGWAPNWVSGPMGRNVADVRLQLAAVAGHASADPLSYPATLDAFAREPRLDPSTLRIGYTEDFGACAVDASIRATFRAKIERLSRIVAQCEPIDIDLREAHRVFDVVRAQEFVASLRETYERDPSLLGANTRANYEMGGALTLADVARAETQRTALYRQFQAHFSRYDVIVSPVSPVTPFAWTTSHCESIDGTPLENYYRWVALTYVVTVLTNPSMSLPCGIDHAGMPFGLQLIGPMRGDARLLDAAQALEGAFAREPALARPVPDLAALRGTPHQARAALRSIVTDPPRLRDASLSL